MVTEAIRKQARDDTAIRRRLPPGAAERWPGLAGRLSWTAARARRGGDCPARARGVRECGDLLARASC